MFNDHKAWSKERGADAPFRVTIEEVDDEDSASATAGVHSEATDVGSLRPDFACANCGLRGRFRCGRCRKQRYCSRDCQRTHWSAGHAWACAEAASIIWLDFEVFAMVFSHLSARAACQCLAVSRSWRQWGPTLLRAARFRNHPASRKLRSRPHEKGWMGLHIAETMYLLEDFSDPSRWRPFGASFLARSGEDGELRANLARTLEEEGDSRMAAGLGFEFPKACKPRLVKFRLRCLSKSTFEHGTAYLSLESSPLEPPLDASEPQLLQRAEPLDCNPAEPRRSGRQQRQQQQPHPHHHQEQQQQHQHPQQENHQQSPPIALAFVAWNPTMASFTGRRHGASPGSFFCRRVLGLLQDQPPLASLQRGATSRPSSTSSSASTASSSTASSSTAPAPPSVEDVRLSDDVELELHLDWRRWKDHRESGYRVTTTLKVGAFPRAITEIYVPSGLRSIRLGVSPGTHLLLQELIVT